MCCDNKPPVKWNSSHISGPFINISNLSMLKFPPELIVHKGTVFYLLYVVGGLLMTVTAGGRWVDVVVKTAESPENLLRLSNTLIRLVGLRHQIHVVNSGTKLKKLYFTESLSSFLDVTGTSLREDFTFLSWFPGSSEKQTNLESTCSNWVSVKRCRIYYVLLCGGNTRLILTLCIRAGGRKLQTHTSPHQLQWLITFSRKVQAQGDVIFLLLGEQTRQISSGSDPNKATAEHHPTGLTLGLSALCVVLLWMLLPHIAVCAVMCLGWKVQQHIR